MNDMIEKKPLQNVLKMRQEMSGHFVKIEKFKQDAEGNEIPGTRHDAIEKPFCNLILDQGLNQYGTLSTWLNACQAGSGSTPPDVTDTGLANYLGGTNSVVSDTFGAQGEAPYYAWRRRTYRFNAGTATGSIAELLICTSTSGSNGFARALVQDGSGNPVTIPKAADEALDVTYELRTYPPLIDGTGTILLDGNYYDFVVRAANVTSDGGSTVSGWQAPTNSAMSGLQAQVVAYEAGIGAIETQPSGSPSFSTSRSSATYVNGSYERQGTAVWGITTGNFDTGIGSLRIKFGIGTHQIGFTPKIPKDNTQELSLTFEWSWGRKA